MVFEVRTSTDCNNRATPRNCSPSSHARRAALHPHALGHVKKGFRVFVGSFFDGACARMSQSRERRGLGGSL